MQKRRENRKSKRKSKKAEHLSMIRSAWNAYHPAYMEFNLKERPDFHGFFARGGVVLHDFEMELAGDVKGRKLLDICCGGDAKQAFSWENLGAEVVACDISPVAIRIAKKNAEKIGSRIRFLVADAQRLKPITDCQFDIVYATYMVWLEDIQEAARSWYRVLKPRGSLLLVHSHPVVDCLDVEGESLKLRRSYFDRSPEYYTFTGTPLADKHGGWEGKVPVVEFFHTFSAIVNALADAGFRIRRMVEPEPEDEESSPKSHLPGLLGFLATKG